MILACRDRDCLDAGSGHLETYLLDTSRYLIPGTLSGAGQHSANHSLNISGKRRLLRILSHVSSSYQQPASGPLSALLLPVPLRLAQVDLFYLVFHISISTLWSLHLHNVHNFPNKRQWFRSKCHRWIILYYLQLFGILNPLMTKETSSVEVS